MFWHLFFWLSLFAELRLLQIGVWSVQYSSIPASELLQIFNHALPLDLSMAAYLLLPVWLLKWFRVRSPDKVWNLLSALVHYSCLFLVLVFSLAETGLYTEWRCKINATALEHLRHPEEVFRTAGLSHYLLFFIPLLLIGIPAVWISKKFLLSQPKDVPFRLLFFQQAFVLLMLITLIRGGWQPIPISQSSAVFSQTDWVNDATVNTCWNLGQSLAEYAFSGGKDRFDFVDGRLAEARIQQLFQQSGTYHGSFLITDRPNLVFLIVEGLSADMISAIGKTPKGYTPTLDRLYSEGIGFTDLYTSAYVSDQGIPAVLSGYPALYGQSITHEPALSRNLPGIFPELNKQNYRTAFFFGGDLGYGNLRAYLIQQGVGDITEEKDLKNKYPSGRLGVHDQYVFQSGLQWCNQAKEPFAMAFFTLSTHLPYDFPEKQLSGKFKNESDYVAAVQYFDRCLAGFLEQAQSEPWFANTLFVITADHSHGTPFNSNNQTASFNRIPLVFWGNVIDESYRGFAYSSTASQTDIAATLLSAMQLNSGSLTWSRNVFDTLYVPFAGIAYHGGSGVVHQGRFSFLSHEAKDRLKQAWQSGRMSSTDSLNLMWCRRVLEGYVKH